MKETKQRSNKEKLILLTIGLALLVLVLVVVLIMSISREEPPILLADGSSQTQLVKPPDNLEPKVQSQQDIQYTLEIKQSDTVREFGTIKTYLFDIINSETEQVCKLSDGNLSFENVTETLGNFLNNNKYKMISIGIVDNKFYIQQDTSKKLDGIIKVNIVSLKNEFTPDDWFSLTEATYNNTDIQADSLFSYQTERGSKHYIYTYLENEINKEAENETAKTEDKLDIQIDSNSISE